MKEREIFAAAMKLNRDQRGEFLAAACGEDASLRQQVNELLAAHEDSGGPLPPREDPEIAATQVPSVRSKVGSLIGPYKLLEEIGEGGMGSVWVAEQFKPIRRKVAIKLIKPGMDSRSVLARFEAERQALALMDHPNIARVLDGGMTDEGRPYFAMEYVKGVPLTEYCDNAKLPIRERLELFLPICQAVQHAHQKGVIHRDLKPSNILVCLYDGKPVPKVIDFGLAKAMHQSLTDKTVYTSHGMMVGTPLYMSPEQAESNNLDVDTRTDIYSLGVILYELLTGSTPLEKAQLKDAAVGEILRLIKEVEPPKPSTRISGSQPGAAAQRSIEQGTLARSVSGDLDWVVMKALEKERGRRYETANGFAEDIRRHLTDEPVSASPPSAGYRMRKFIKRNRVSVIAGSSVAVALLLGVLGTTGGLVWALQEKSNADTALQKSRASEQQASTNAERAKQETARARRAELEAKQAAKRSTDVLKVVTHSFARTNPDRGATYTMTAQQVLLRAYEAVDVSELDDRGKRDLLWVLGSSLQGLGDHATSISIWKEAVSLCEANDGPSHRLTLAGMMNLANSYQGAGRNEESLELREKILELQTEHLGPTHRDTLASMTNLANSYNQLGRNWDCLELREKVLSLKRAHLGNDNRDTLLAMVNLAHSYYYFAGETEQAAALYKEALPMMQNKLPPGNQNTLNALRGLAMAYWSLGRAEDAERIAQEALSLSQTRYGPSHDATRFCEECVEAVGQAHDSSYAAAKLMNGRIWAKVASPIDRVKSPVSSEDLRRFRKICSLHESPMLLNTLSVAEYRGENFRRAIAVSLPQASSEHPIDLAILAMSYHRLGETERANVYRGRFEAKMSEGKFRSVRQKEHCLSFQAELEGLFGEQPVRATRTLEFAPSTHQASAAFMATIGEWELAIEDCDRALKGDPALRPVVGGVRGRALAALQRWEEAADEFAVGLEDGPQERWLSYIPALVLSGDRSVYQVRCQQGLEMAGDTTDPKVADVVCKLCLLVPDVVDVKELPVAIVEQALDDESTRPHLRPWFWASRALVALRGQEFEPAIEYVNESQSLGPNDRLRALNESILALAQHALSRPDAARKALSTAKQLLQKLEASPPDRGHHDLLIATILFREADARVFSK